MEQIYKKDRFAALLVYLDLTENSDDNTYISSRTIEKNLEEKYGIENRPSHNVISEILKELEKNKEQLGLDVRKGRKNQGYCLNERYFQPWEISLFAEEIISCRTLSMMDKKDLVERMSSYLGPSYQDCYEYLYDYMDEDEKENSKHIVSGNVEENMKVLLQAIRQKKTVHWESLTWNMKMFEDRGMIASPYRIFDHDNRLCLLFGTADRNNKTRTSLIELSNISNVHITEDRYIPFEETENNDERIKEKTVRINPNLYKRNNVKITIELIPDLMFDGEYRYEYVKTLLGEHFVENIEYAHQRERQLAYVNASQEDIEWLIQLDKVKIIAPQDAVNRAKYRAKVNRNIANEVCRLYGIADDDIE